MKPLLPVAVALATVALLAASSPAQVFVPNSNPAVGACNGYPWSIHSEWRFQMHIPAAALGAQPFRITEMGFAPCGSTSFSSPQCEIRMAHLTTSTLSRTFDANLAKDRTVVFSGPLSWTLTASQWSDVGLTAPFDYNGGEDLVVEIRYTSRQGGTSCHTDAATIHRLYTFGTGAYNTASGVSQIDKHAPNLRFTVITVSLTGSGSPRPGGAIDLGLLSVADPGRPYQVGTALGEGPIPLGSRQIGLSADDLLMVSTLGLLPTVFVNYAGVLDAGGQAKARIDILNDRALIGIRLHSAFVTLDPSAPFGIRSISNTFSFSIQN
jgi:hypothetical protein